MQLPQQVSEQGSENDVTLTLSQETNDQSTLSEPSRDHHHYIEETTGFIFDRFDLVEAVARTAGGESPMKLVCDFGSGYVLLKDNIDYLVSTQADCERLNDIESGDQWVHSCIESCDFCLGWDDDLENFKYCEKCAYLGPER